MAKQHKGHQVKTSPYVSTFTTLAIGGLGGLLFYFLSLPAPFMLGSMLSCWALGGLMPRARPFLTVPWPLRFAVVSLVAVVLGSYATPASVANMLDWWPSLLALALSSIAMTWISYAFFKARGYDDLVAWFAAQPAGLSEIVTLAGRHTDKDYLVALFHLVRVSTVFLFAPLLVWVVAQDFDTQAVPDGQIHFWQLTWFMWLLFPLAAVLGTVIGRRIGLPMPSLLGPMLLTALVSGAGILELERPFEVICLIQVALGASIGGRMGQVDFRKLWSSVPDAYMNAIVIIAIALGVAGVVSALTAQPMLKIFLAISPGGVSELSLIAVALGYEVAFITLHHLFRMAVVLFAMPIKKLPPER